MWSIYAFTALLAGAAALAPHRRDLTFDYSRDKVYGVNIGGWLVLEPWITPSLFPDSGSAADEYTLMQQLGSNAQSTMEKHWDSWITEGDFQQIAKSGLNHVRVPVGYWAVKKLDGDPYVQGQLYRLDSAVTWARAAGLKMMIDLHGVPGSQNGFDNSGHRGDIKWQSVDPGATTTKSVIDFLANRYASASDVVTSIELVNEPMGANGALDLNQIKQYYQDGWGVVRNHNKDTVVVLHDAFQDIQSWNGFMSGGSQYNNVMLDTHIYQVFSDGEVAMSPSAHVSAACGRVSGLRSTDKWTVVGEWTGAQTDCAKWLNGFGKGARYDGTFSGSSRVGSCDGKYTGTVAGLSSDDKKNLRSYLEAQLDAFVSHTGWFFWTWKTESAPEWDLQDLIAGGLFPQPLSDRQYPNQCA